MGVPGAVTDLVCQTGRLEIGHGKRKECQGSSQALKLKHPARGFSLAWSGRLLRVLRGLSVEIALEAGLDGLLKAGLCDLPLTDRLVHAAPVRPSRVWSLGYSQPQPAFVQAFQESSLPRHVPPAGVSGQRVLCRLSVPLL